ncbi:MAG TPA: hypothetical protein DDZ80_29635 [Cyanobacteria bacterium UBA8803]|nr:hypothetical protein [Cyanobacteria bacterium UBA9273]HBL62405.1 hypothetical protein [Cyanobacteria bacterium UBA8803]
MESSGSSSANPSNPQSYRWADLIGALIAVLTLTIPLFVIAYYSSSSSLGVLPGSGYSLPRSQE